jgi:predicted RNA polymerase sigma factor
MATEPMPAYPEPSLDENEGASRDDTLILLFMCCHPALTPASAVALTLRAVGGLTTSEIASAFLVPETIMAQRISGRNAHQDVGLPFLMPTGKWTGRRAPSCVLTIFNGGTPPAPARMWPAPTYQ